MELLAPEPVRVTVEYLDITLTAGNSFSAALRPDRGDVLEESPDSLTVRFGSGEVTTITRSAIALLTRRTGTLTLPAKPLNPAAGIVSAKQ